jgi:hypothetical protein
MGQLGRKIAAVLLVGIAAACGTASASSVTLSSYAAGNWKCAAKFSAGGHTFTLKPSAVVTATSATTGAVEIRIPYGPPIPTQKLSGQWSLGGSELMVQWSKRDEGTAQAKPITLQTKEFRIRSGTPANAKWSKVTVNRKARSVTFGFPIEPVGQPNQTMTCRKA